MYLYYNIFLRKGHFIIHIHLYILFTLFHCYKNVSALLSELRGEKIRNNHVFRTDAQFRGIQQL